MKALLPYYEKELSDLRSRGRAFAQAYPKIAAALQIGSDKSADPHAERMIESFALLSARIHKRLDDDFPLFTESLLEVLYPHYLRPFPSCSIAQFQLGAAIGQLSKPSVVNRGTVLSGRPVQGVACKFKTTQDVRLLPLVVDHVSFRSAVVAPSGTRLPSDATSVLSLSLSLKAPQARWDEVMAEPLRFYLDGDSAQVSVLREALCTRVADVLIQWREGEAWQGASTSMAETSRPCLAGFDEDQALLPADPRSHEAYRLLTEYFSYPEKFNFVDVPFPGANAPLAQPGRLGPGEATERSVTLHLVMRGIRADSDECRLLEMVDVRNLQLGCTPVINHFEQPADPIRITHESTSYPVVVDGRRAFGYEVYSINKVFRVKKTAQGESIQEFRPFFSIRHDDWLDEAESMEEPRSDSGCYWFARRDDEVGEQSPGYETELSIVDLDFQPTLPQTESLSLQVSATNRDLPSRMTIGAAGGDLFMEGGGLAKEIRLLKKPSLSMRFERGNGALWRLISHLSLNHLSLTLAGADGLREMFRLYDLPRSATNRRQIDAIQGIEFKPATAWLPGQPFACFVRGTEIRVVVDESGFVGAGLSLFVSVLDHFFGLYVHANSFTQLTVVSARTNEVVMSCPPRNGAMQLV
ncbi:MAG: type VI secretion system baseplate subunit TssF [Burkholderiales bacterium]|nr:type VI secretion system baseplate subunit TssF [Burkholderiales bacterium]